MASPLPPFDANETRLGAPAGVSAIDGDVTRLGPGEGNTRSAPTSVVTAPEQGGPLVPGQPFAGRYHIVRLLGLGGMGAVYQAWDDALSVVVALKVIRPEIAGDPEAAQTIERRFKQELLLARQVTHKNVVRIHDLGDVGGIKYITMPFINGHDLASIADREAPLAVPRVARKASSANRVIVPMRPSGFRSSRCSSP